MPVAICISTNLEKPYDNHIFLLSQLLDCFDSGQWDSRRSCPLLQPVNDLRGGPSTLVLGRFTGMEELQSWVATNLEFLTQFWLFGSIDLSQTQS